MEGSCSSLLGTDLLMTDSHGAAAKGPPTPSTPIPGHFRGPHSASEGTQHWEGMSGAQALLCTHGMPVLPRASVSPWQTGARCHALCRVPIMGQFQPGRLPGWGWD